MFHSYLLSPLLAVLSVMPSAGNQPDLVPILIQTTTSTIQPGQSFGVSYDTCNQGSLGTAIMWGDQFYLNSSPSLSGAKLLGGSICKWFPNFILPGYCYSTFEAPTFHQVTLPANTTPGTWWIGVRVNVSNSLNGPCTPAPWIVGESTYQNNTLWTSITVPGPASDPPCTFNTLPNTCGVPLLLLGADSVSGGTHALKFTLLGSATGDTLFLLAGFPTVAPIPSSVCFLYVAPTVIVPKAATGPLEVWEFPGVQLPPSVSATVQVLRVKASGALDAANGSLVDCP